MYALSEEPIRMTEDEYLAFDRSSKNRHELLDNYIIAMAGASRRHILITGNAYASLHSQLRQRPCEVYQSEMRVRVKAGRSYYYPDIVVVCGEPQFIDASVDTLTNPTLLIEVLSPSREKKDREVKAKNYRQMPSVQEYLFIEQDEVSAEHYVRKEDRWEIRDYEALTGIIELSSIDCRLALADVYEKIKFEAGN
jgi:Uma2 family endonuclease